MTIVFAAAAVYPDTLAASANGSAVDFGIGNTGYAVQDIGEVSDGITLDAKLQESANGSTGWTDITGAAFTTITDSFHVEAIRFTATKRYVRWVGTIAGTSPSAAASVLLVR